MTDPTAIDLGDSWKPPALREAEAQLDATMAKSREMIKQVEEKLKSMPDIDHTAKPEDVTAIKAAAAKPDAPAPLRALKKKVEAGELTWEDVLEGKALKDETVREVMATRLGDMREMYQEFEEGATLEEVLEARGVTSDSVFTTGGGASTTSAQSAPAAPPSEDDYFAGGGHLMSNPPQSQPTPPSPPAPPKPEPPAPPAGGRPPQQPRRSAPPRREREDYTDDEFENPLASRNPPEEKPKPSSPPRSNRRRGGGDDGGDDDYFGGSILR